MSVAITAAGAWGPGFSHWTTLRGLLRGEAGAGESDARGPRPDIIPPNERRRAPLPVRLAVESSWQALEAAGRDAREVACVFASGLGDTDITDYMCRVLAGDRPMISPTKFHNSVHNAAAGYWTISTGCMRAANSIAAFDCSFSLALMEAATQCALEKTPVLLTCFDAPVSTLLRPMLINEQPFSASLLLEPDVSAGGSLTIRTDDGPAPWPALDCAALRTLYETNPAARILTLLEAWSMDRVGETTLRLPLGSAVSLSVTLGAAP